jgi:hypothetical protein
VKASLGFFLLLSSAIPGCSSCQSPSLGKSSKCGSEDAPNISSFQQRWWRAQKNPDIYCPVGYDLPKASFGSYTSNPITFECIALADERVRFFIPKGPEAESFRKEALAYRETSKDAAFKSREFFTGTAEKIGSGVFWTVWAVLNAVAHTGI